MLLQLPSLLQANFIEPKMLEGLATQVKNFLTQYKTKEKNIDEET